MNARSCTLCAGSSAANSSRRFAMPRASSASTRASSVPIVNVPPGIATSSARCARASTTSEQRNANTSSQLFVIFQSTNLPIFQCLIGLPRFGTRRLIVFDVSEQILNRGKQMAGPPLVGVHDRRVAERREVRAPLAVALHPRDTVILIGTRAQLAETPAESTVRFLDVNAHQHALLLARVRRVERKDVELVGMRERLRAERLHERARRIVDLENLLFHAMLPRPAAHHFCELGPVQIRVRDGVIAAESA